MVRTARPLAQGGYEQQARELRRLGANGKAGKAYVDAFARDDVLLGAEGYALTTLSCALDVLADGDDSGEQPVLDLGGESWPAPPAPPPASPLGGEDWPEPS